MTDVYVAQDQDGCGCITAVCVDEPSHQKDVAKDVASYIRRGDRVTRMPIEEFWALPFRCERHPKGTPSPWEARRKPKPTTDQAGVVWNQERTK